MSKERSGRPAKRVVAGVALGLVLVALSACQTGPVYQPRGPNGVVGYTDEQLTPNRYRVTFTGSTGTKREQVEDYLLRRAAEVTLQSGYTHFRFDTRDTRERTYYRTTFGSYSGFDWRYGPGFGPRSRFGLGLGFGPRPFYWSSFAFNDPWYSDQIIPVTRFSAYSEIVTLDSDQAVRDPDAIAARDILARLVPPPPPAGA